MGKILLVEDQLFFKKMMEHILLREGYEVVSCASGETAVDLINDSDFLAVLTDYKMGNVSGLDVARAAKERRPPIPVFIITAYAGDQYNIGWGGLPDRIFDKPVDSIALIEAIEKLEEGSKVEFKESADIVRDPICGMDVNAGYTSHKEYYN